MREISVTVCSILDGLAEHIAERGIYTVHEGYAYGWEMTNASYILDEGMQVVLFLYYDRMYYYRDISVDRNAFDASGHDDYEAYMHSMGLYLCDVVTSGGNGHTEGLLLLTTAVTGSGTTGLMPVP